MEQIYLTYFQSLHTNKTKGQIAPHKAILLLSIIDQIEQGIIKTNHITLTDSLEEQFMINWSRYVGNSDIFQPKVGTPFAISIMNLSGNWFHMKVVMKL